MSRQLPLPGPLKTDCPCGCGLFGTPRRKVWRGELLGHIKGCPCNRCQGSRHKKNAGDRERRIAKSLGGQRSALSGSVSGYDISTDLIEIEETSNASINAGLKRWWYSQKVERKMARLMARNLRVRVFLASWDGGPKLAVMPFEDLRALLELAGKSDA